MLGRDARGVYLEADEDAAIDSAATTLLPSPESSKAHSLDWQRQPDFGTPNLAGIEHGDNHSVRHSDDHEANRLLDAPTTGLPINESTTAPTGPAPPPIEQVTWRSLPSKSQLAILTLARLSEPLTQTSLQAYMFYMLKSFPDTSSSASGGIPSDALVARQAGILAASFTGAQFLWGRVADSASMGRKRVILIGLLGSAVGTLGFGFSRSFAQAVGWRVVGGMLNGNIGVMRTMISEIVVERRFLSRAFLLLPMTFNIGVIIGPVLGGVLADPVASFPGMFGKGYEGWMKTFPYALPNVVMACFLAVSALGVVMGLEETSEAAKGRGDWGLKFSRAVGRLLCGKRETVEYAALAGGEEDIEMRAPEQDSSSKLPPLVPRRKLPFRRIWTPNLLFTLLSHGLLASHVGTFSSLWFIFLSTPRYTPNSTNNDHDSSTLHLPDGYTPKLPFTFTGGLALPPRSIGVALAILGVIGISLQLLLFPRLSFRLGTIRSFRFSLLLFPLSYALTPFLAVLPSSHLAPSQASGIIVWLGITLILCIQVLARTFALPSTAILINNASPHPSVLGTVHGIAQSVSSATRTVGPVFAGWVYGVGLQKGVVGLAWWGLAGTAIVGAVAGRWVREGDGHEIWLDGEREEVEGRGKEEG